MWPGAACCRAFPPLSAAPASWTAACSWFCYNRETGGFETTEIEGDTGPANVCVVLGKDKDLILAANHRIGEGAVYTVTD